jgi:hypothetical protein
LDLAVYHGQLGQLVVQRDNSIRIRLAALDALGRDIRNEQLGLALFEGHLDVPYWQQQRREAGGHALIHSVLHARASHWKRMAPKHTHIAG